jgi:hypothetical protein
MGQVIDFPVYAADKRPPAGPEQKCRCARCGADLWHILDNGEICCADCEAACPFRLLNKSAQ